MVDDSLINLRETIFVNMETFADGSYVQTLGTDNLVMIWEDWTDFDCAWMSAPVFTDQEVSACLAYTKALSDFDELDVEDTTCVQGLRSIPQYKSVEAFAKIAFEVMSKRGPRPALEGTQ
ncbi:hypothetical protein GCM10007385_23310 [Tateyamaria omphalii]|uniref:hypothetical protein n=1 Tax=Tateyamaria omphalii TaxID=299262 RepID=UPI001671B7A4|nr:hypothetical protein [Tateyamaria omphalii]GGX54406.1 hypothetical protein GCM10007385_23310 [Tateyamaria omphalii]